MDLIGKQPETSGCFFVQFHFSLYLCRANQKADFGFMSDDVFAQGRIVIL